MDPPPTTTLRLLGGFELAVGDRVLPTARWRLRKSVTLLKLLALAPGRQVHCDEATELLWADRRPSAARNNLHQALFVARRALDAAGLDGRTFVALDHGLLKLGPCWVDVEAFERTAAGALGRGDPSLLRTALELYRGELLPEDRYEDWASTRRLVLTDLHVALLIELGGALSRRGDHAAALDAFASALSVDPLHQDAAAGVMFLHAYAGRHARAIRQYEQLRDALASQQGGRPRPGLRLLHRRLLSGQDIRPARAR
jgi:DNA-binding SARP family transcriptional activator